MNTEKPPEGEGHVTMKAGQESQWMSKVARKISGSLGVASCRWQLPVVRRKHPLGSDFWTFLRAPRQCILLGFGSSLWYLFPLAVENSHSMRCHALERALNLSHSPLWTLVLSSSRCHSNTFGGR